MRAQLEEVRWVGLGVGGGGGGAGFGEFCGGGGGVGGFFGGAAAAWGEGERAALEIADADGAFFGAAEYGDDAPEGGRFLEEGEEVGD